MGRTYRIVVGVDGSEGGARALRWAVREARAREAVIEAVTAFSFDDVKGSSVRGREEQRQAAEQMLSAAVSHALNANPRVTISTKVVLGDAHEALVERASRADLLVLGSHGHGRVHQAVLGSVAEECIRAASCPVLVVPVPHHERVASAAPAEVPSAIL